MRYLTFVPEQQCTFDTCFLVPHLHQSDMQRFYIDPHMKGQEASLYAYDLVKNPGKGATKVSTQREYLDELLPVLSSLGTTFLIICDAEYFKTITKNRKAESELGYIHEVDGYPDMKAVYCPNYRARFNDPQKWDQSAAIGLKAFTSFKNGTYREPGTNILHFAEYPDSVGHIRNWLERLVKEDRPLAADIEGFSLKHYECGLGTISFAWNKHEGIAFRIDLNRDPEEAKQIRALLGEFFRTFKNKLLWHNISFDAYVLIYQLFMEHLIDTEGLLDGLEVMTKNWECTKLITYLATNSCSGNQLGLKYQAREFAGNYAVEEIEDITQVPPEDLLEYNLIDSCSTWFVYEKHWDTMVQDQQLDIYTNLFKPGIKDILQMQLTGLPVDMDEVHKVNAELQATADDATAKMLANPIVGAFMHEYRLGWIEKENAKLKTKTRSMKEAEAKVEFNPNSPNQLQEVLYGKDHMHLPVLDRTDTKAPATGKDTLKKLLNHTTDPDEVAFLEALIEFKLVNKLLTAFIPALLAAPQGPDGWHYLFGNFNLGGTVSGRLSSSGPNLQNLPAKGKLAKMIKRCFKAPPGWLFCGLDFASLEDRISALTTKDPNKLKVYIGHNVFELEIDGETHLIRDDTELVYEGEVITGGRLYELLEGTI